MAEALPEKIGSPLSVNNLSEDLECKIIKRDILLMNRATSFHLVILPIIVAVP